MSLALVSHKLCPYVQRAAIVLYEKGVPFERRWVDLADKPDWFRGVSPLGKTPVLLVGETAVFESAVICEYLDEVHAPRLHPDNPLERARHRSWMEFGSGVLDRIAALYNAPDALSFGSRRDELHLRLAQVEAVLDARGPFFAGAQFGMVDAVFAPVLRYFDVFDALGVGGWLEGRPRLQSWRDALMQRASVQAAAAEGYPQRLTQFLLARGSELSRRIAVAA